MIEDKYELISKHELRMLQIERVVAEEILARKGLLEEYCKELQENFNARIAILIEDAYTLVHCEYEKLKIIENKSSRVKKVVEDIGERISKIEKELEAGETP